MKGRVGRCGESRPDAGDGDTLALRYFLTFTPLHCSSSRERRPPGLTRNKFRTEVLSLKEISRSLSPSLAYSTCSRCGRGMAKHTHQC